MRLNQPGFQNSPPINGYGPGFFRIGGTVYRGSVLILPGSIAPWAGYGDAAGIVAAVGDIDLVLVGTGAEMAAIPPGFREMMETAGIGLEPMASPVACRTYNLLLGEGRRLGAALLPV